MNRRTSAVFTLTGSIAAIIAGALFGPIFAGIVALATVCFAAFGKPILGSTHIPEGTAVDPQEVRRYRLEHPDATISEATAAVARR